MSCGVVSCHIVELLPSRVSFQANRHFVFYFWWIFLLILWLAAVYEPYVISDEQSRQSKEGCGEGCGWIPSCSALAKYRNVLPDIIASLLFLISVVSLVYTVTAHTHTHRREPDTQAQLYISHFERCSGVTEPYLAAEQIPHIDWSLCGLFPEKYRRALQPHMMLFSAIPPRESFTRSGQMMHVMSQHTVGNSDGCLWLAL